MPNALAGSRHREFPPVRVQDGKLFAGDEELFLNAVGYSGIRPGRDQFDPLRDDKVGYRLIDHDMRLIREAGFNAIRTWAILDEKLIELAAKHGLWVIGGIWTDPNINLADENAMKLARETVLGQARICARYPNVALLLIINEPNPGIMANPDAAAYLRSLAAAGKKTAGGIPVSFANMPNAAFVDPGPWDVISHNIYAHPYPDFLQSIGYRNYVELVRKLSAGGRPFFVSEYGFYAPVPDPNVHEPWITFCVKDENEQRDLLLRDQRALLPLGLAGATLMMWADDWRNFNEVPEAKPYIRDPARNKFNHDMFTQEWGGIVALDADIRGTPRAAYDAFKQANQALLLQPDPQLVYDGALPLRFFVTEKVGKILASLDAGAKTAIPRESPHWFSGSLAVKAPSGTPKKKTLSFEVYDRKGRTLAKGEQAVWIGEPNPLPQIELKKLGRSFKPGFEVELRDGQGRPLAGVPVRWGVLDVFQWRDAGGTIETDENGRAEFVSPWPGTLLVGAGYDHREGDYSRRIAGLVLAH